MARLLPWVALAAAFSPLLIEIAEHLRTEAWARYVLWFVLLVPLAILRHGGGAPAHRAGFVLIIAGLALQLLGIGGEFVRYARPALPLATVGLCLALGAAPLRVALLSAWWVPVPSLLLTLAKPALENAQLGLVAGALAALGAPLEIEPLGVRSAGERLRLTAGINGPTLLALLAGFGWYAGLRRQEAWPGLLRRAALWALAAIPIQLLALTVAVGALLAAGGEAATAVLLWLPLPVGAAALALAEHQALRERQTAR